MTACVPIEPPLSPRSRSGACVAAAASAGPDESLQSFRPGGLHMTDKTPTEYLAKTRMAMVERRRFLVREKVDSWINANIKTGQKLPFTELVELQKCIDAIDHALADEKDLVPRHVAKTFTEDDPYGEREVE
jgi:hypothetical protein